MSRPHRQHHIGDVAHHFLADEGPEAASPAAVVVAGAGDLRLTAFAAAGAARTGQVGAGEPWCLLEDVAPIWSAAGLLPADGSVQALAHGDWSAAAHARRGLCWHLGAVDDTLLDVWTAAVALPGCRLPTAGRPVHLLWCLARQEVGALAPLALLGRLADLLEPARTDLLVADRDWLSGPGGRRPAAAVPADPALGARLETRATALAGGAVRVRTVAPSMTAAAAAALITGLLTAAIPS